MSDHRAARIRSLVHSYIRRMSRECDRLGGVNLGQGICDLPTHDEVRLRTIEAIESQQNTYSPCEGASVLREAVAEKMRAYNGIACDPETEVVVTVGSTGAFANVCWAFLDPGDEVILFEPFYGYHLNTVRVAGGTPRFVALHGRGGEIDESKLAKAFSDRTKLVVVNTPCNPSGKVFSRDELGLIARLCSQWDAIAVTDEIYEYILYDGARHVSLATIDGMQDRTITISGFSKTFSITGWRLGYAVAPRELAGPLALVNDVLYVCAPTPLQHGVAQAMQRVPASYYSELAADYQRKRDFWVGAMKASGFDPWVPRGAYYLLAGFSERGYRDDHEAAMKLLEEHRVAAIPGSSFFAGDQGSRLLRFCFAKSMPELEEAARNLSA